MSGDDTCLSVVISKSRADLIPLGSENYIGAKIFYFFCGCLFCIDDAIDEYGSLYCRINNIYVKKTCLIVLILALASPIQ